MLTDQYELRYINSVTTLETPRGHFSAIGVADADDVNSEMRPINHSDSTYRQ